MRYSLIVSLCDSYYTMATVINKPVQLALPVLSEYNIRKFNLKETKKVYNKSLCHLIKKIIINKKTIIRKVLGNKRKKREKEK